MEFDQREFQMPQGRSPCLFQKSTTILKCELHHMQPEVSCFLLQRGCYSYKCTDYLFKPFHVSINFSFYVTSSLTPLTSTCVSLSQTEMWRSQSSSRETQGAWESARGNTSGRRPVGRRNGVIIGKVRFTVSGRHELELLE